MNSMGGMSQGMSPMGPEQQNFQNLMQQLHHMGGGMQGAGMPGGMMNQPDMNMQMPGIMQGMQGFSMGGGMQAMGKGNNANAMPGVGNMGMSQGIGMGPEQQQNLLQMHMMGGQGYGQGMGMGPEQQMLLQQMHMMGGGMPGLHGTMQGTGMSNGMMSQPDMNMQMPGIMQGMQGFSMGGGMQALGNGSNANAQQGGGMGMPGLMGGMGNVPGGMNMGMAGGRPPAFAGGMASMPEVEKMLRGNQENMGGNQGPFGMQAPMIAGMPGGKNPIGGMEQNIPAQNFLDFGDMSKLFQMMHQNLGGMDYNRMPDGNFGQVGGNHQNPFQSVPGSGPSSEPQAVARAQTNSTMSPGIQLWRDPRNTEVTVIGIPNKECGVNEGDIIKCIDSRKVKEWSIQKCHERLNGPAGSKVELTTNKGKKINIERTIPVPEKQDENQPQTQEKPRQGIVGDQNAAQMLRLMQMQRQMANAMPNFPQHDMYSAV